MITVWVFFSYTVINTTNFDKVLYICILPKTERYHGCCEQEVDTHIFISVNTSPNKCSKQLEDQQRW